jgi:hypothetical protein
LGVLGSACLPRQRKGQVQLDAVVYHPGGDAAARAAFEADQAVAFHGPERARQVRLGLAGDAGQLVERAGRLLGDDAQQFAIAESRLLPSDVNQTFGSFGETRRSPRATAMVRAFISS